MRILFTRNAVYTLAAIFAVAALFLVTMLARRSTPTDEAVEVIEKPKVRPERLDLGKFTTFKGLTMAEILETIGNTGINTTLEKSAAGALISSLPDEPFPFPKGAKPENEIALKQFVQSIEGGKLGAPSMVDRWRYNLASAALGTSSDAIPEELRLETEPRNETENFPVRLVSKVTDLKGPVVAGEFDGVEGMELISDGGAKIWSISGDGSTVERAGLQGTPSGTLVDPADYDNDGDLDLFISRRGGAPNSLMQNDGKGNFEDVTMNSGLLAFSDTASVAWTDYDQDGLLDLIIGNHDHPFEIYRQVQIGKFEPVCWELDMWIPNPVKQVKVADLNNDSFPDLLLSISGMVDQMLFSIPSSDPLKWRFLEKGEENQIPLEVDHQSFATIDLDNDGDLDLLLGKSSPDSEERISEALNNRDYQPENHLRLFINDGEGVFSQFAEGSGLDGVEDVKAIHVADFDNDGFEDVFVVTGDLSFNRALWNRGGVQFRDVSQTCRLNYLDSPVNFNSFDLNQNGQIDVFLTEADGSLKWLEAESPNGNGWIDLNLTNSPAGTRVKILARDTDWILQPIQRVTGMVPCLTLGLGQIDKIEQIEIFPPHSIKAVETLKKVKPNQILNITIPEKVQQTQETEQPAPS